MSHKLFRAEAISLAERSLGALAIPARDASIIARHLVEAERRGYPGHGLRRIISFVQLRPRFSGAQSNRITVEKPGFMLVDGNGRLGIAAVFDGLETASQKLAEAASVVVGVTGYLGTTGSLGIFSAHLSRKGITSILMCNSEFAVAPYGSSRAVIGTNPIAISIPGNPVSFLADTATAAWSYGSIRDAAEKGKTIPEGVVQTSEGYPSTDPNDADNGSQLPMAGHKGYALGLAVELLSGPLIGAKAGRDAVPGGDGFFAVLVRTDAARPAESVNSDMQRLFQEIKSGPRSPGFDNLRIPGERSQDHLDGAGTVEVDESLLEKLEQLCRSK